MSSSSNAVSLEFPVLGKNRLWRHYPYSKPAWMTATMSVEEIAASLKAQQILYEADVAKAIQEAKDSAAAFATLTVEEMADYYFDRPDERLWTAITALVPADQVAKAEDLGDCMWEEKMEREERMEKMSRDYGY